ncbi:DUF6932 family protein [Streptomyces erythrochromogenes]|uniref:DUF6932 family protein n=1 Tax=Streptomyces erythrochromogenes TaxID=285574 RepID=UPI0038660B22|nr:hypothetical protein OG364_27085 [Streptomyces erythrochromogenes]
MPLPQLNDLGYLPPGEHSAQWKEIELTFGWNYKRKNLLVGLHYTVKSLVEFGVDEFYIDGSFVTEKPRPRDIEVIYMPLPAKPKQSWGLFDFSQHEALKRQHEIDLWPYPSPQRTSRGTVTIKDFFSFDRNDTPKGIIRLDLEGFE